MQSEVKFSDAGSVLVASLSGEIDHHTAKTEREAIDSMLFLKKPDMLVLDFSGVRFMDSSGIGLIIGRAEVSRGIGCKVKVCGLSPALNKLVRLSGVEKIDNVLVER